MGIREVVEPRDSDDGFGGSRQIEHRHVGRGHADHAPGIAVEHLPLETRGGQLAVPRDEEPRFDPLGPLPGVADLQHRAGGAVRPDDLESRGVARGVERPVVVVRRGAPVSAGGEERGGEQDQQPSHDSAVFVCRASAGSVSSCSPTIRAAQAISSGQGRLR